MLPGNPHALIKSGVCTAVVAMQEYDLETIAATLSSQKYDKVINCSEIGYEINVGYTYYKYADTWAAPSRYKNWILSETSRTWQPPIPYPTDGGSYFWSEEHDNWTSCTSDEVATAQEQELVSLSDDLYLNESIDLVAVYVNSNQVDAKEKINAN